ncbi:uncharacterized protein [Asterias amurensis]|uniref:uncharacterized protein n=1 Tax=Asterias amurensis TaxID=7602 RepID=UPI003AB5E78D
MRSDTFSEEYELKTYKSICGIKSRELENLEQKMLIANIKLSKFSTRNVTKRIQRREKAMTSLRSEQVKSATAIKELEEEIMLTRQQAPSQLYDYEKRIHTLEQRVRELEECLADSKYTDQVRELIMELLAMNVSMSKVGKVIQATISKLTTLEIGRLSSLATISKLIIEAKVLADIEVGLAMKASTPESALGNVIHGDGTTKFHKKYQNFQVTLADGTSRTMGLIQVGHADTEAVMASVNLKKCTFMAFFKK